MVEIDRHKASLIAELEVSRSEVRNALARCEESLDVVSLLRRNVQENKVAWAASARVALCVFWAICGRRFLFLSVRMSMTEGRSSSVSWHALAEPLPLALGLAQLLNDLLLGGLEPVLLQL